MVSEKLLYEMLWGSLSISQAVQFLSSFEGEQNDDEGISITLL